MNDVRGTPVSCSDPAQLDGYERALRSYQNYVGDPIATIDAVLSEHDDFVLGHVFRSAVLMTAGERRVVSDAERSIRSAESTRRLRQRSREGVDAGHATAGRR